MEKSDVTLLLRAAEDELQHLDVEIGRLQSMISRRDQLRAFVQMGKALFADDTGKDADDIALAAALAETRAPKVVPVGMFPANSGRHQIREAAARIISAEGPTRTKDLIGKLEAQGIEIRGINKIDTVSVILSRARDRFKADRSAGWSLVEKQGVDVASSGDSPVATELQTQQEDATSAP